MEQRLIDANALLERLERKKCEPAKVRYTEGYNDALMRFRSMVHGAPTVDAVPVPDGGIGELSKPILCKECIHRPKMPDNHVDGFDLEFPDHECPCRCEDGFYSWYPADDWFCANGERRSDEQ